MVKSKKNWLRLMRLIGIVIFIWILSRISFSHLGTVLSQVNIPLLLLSFAIIFVIYFIKMLRWHYLVKQTELSPSLKESWYIYNIGIFLASITPAKLGEIGRASYLVKAGLNKKTSIGIVIVDRIADVIITSFLLIIACVFIFGWLITTIVLMFLSALIASLFILEKKKQFVKNIKSSMPFFKKILKFDTATYVLLLTIVNWIVYYMWAILVARSVGIEVSSGILVLVFTIAGTIAVLPIAPSGLGTRDIALITLLTPYGVPMEQIVILALLMFTTPFISSILGLWYWIRGCSMTPLPKQNYEA
ncbi:flippase-like domain-containing protein [Patescibacteria group bacterium]|nr:flippase-like domain-containing protein [Patescibacteria group bacterium]